MARAAILSLLILAGCVATPPGHPPTLGQSRAPAMELRDHPLQGFKWRAVMIGGLPVVPASEVYVRFAGDSVHGHAGCNGFGGRHRLLPGGGIHIGDTTSTLIGCFSDAIGDQERRFHQLLHRTVRYAIEQRAPGDVRLTLATADGGTLVFRREAWVQPGPPGSPPPPLPRTEKEAILEREWSALTIHGTPVLPGARPTLRLATGEASGSAGCNRYFGRFDFDPNPWDQKIHLGALAATRRACADPILQAQEQRFLEALQGTMIYSVDSAGILTLTAANMRTITFAPAR